MSVEKLQRFRDILASVTWENVYSKSTSDEAYDCFIDKFCNVYKATFPVKTLYLTKHCRKPWISKAILDLISLKNRLYKKFICTKDLAAFGGVINLRNNLVKVIKKLRF